MIHFVLALLTSIVLASGSVSAATYYVATNGNNSNNGTSESTPWLTIKKATDTMVAGDTTYVRGGTYNETARVRFNTPGTSAAPIKLLNYPGEAPILNCSGTSSSNQLGILIQNSLGYNRAMGWITVEGFEIRNCWDGIKMYNAHDAVFRRNWVHDNTNQGILGNGTRVLIERNIVNHNGPHATNPGSSFAQGVYLHGTNITIAHNVIYDTTGYGIQQNGSPSSYFTTTAHPSVEFSGAQNWIVVGNTLAYQKNRAGIVVWGDRCSGSRYENNIFYENYTAGASGNVQGIDCTSCINSTSLSIKNNHFYASGSGGQTGIHSTFTGIATISGNVTNVSAPAFVNGGSNALPVSPDFRLTASAPVNIALANEFPNNATNVVGAYKTVGTPTATITTNKITITFPMSTAVPIQNLTTAGVSTGCTGVNCPGSHSVSSVSRLVGTDTKVEVTLSGLASNACVSTNQTWTVSYASASGSWTGNDNIGVYPGSHQKIFSFTSLSVTNQCTGSGPPAPTASDIFYPMDDGSGTTVTDTAGGGSHATLVNGAGWAAGKTGTGVYIAGGTTQQMTIPAGSGINPTTQSMTWIVPVFIPTGQTNATNFVFGTEIGTDQRGYIAATNGTWKVGRQNINTITAGSSNLSVSEGWNHLCLRWDSTTDTVTLYKNGVVGTGGATGSYTSYTFPGNYEAPILGSGFPGTTSEVTYDDVQLFSSLQDCAALYAGWNASPAPIVGTLSQAAVQFQGVTLDSAGSPIVMGPSVQSIDVPAGGGVVLLFQVHCTNVADCALTSFKLVYDKNGANVWQHVPDTETTDGTWMWGLTTEANLNIGTRSTRLTGTCAVTTGATQITSAQTPSVDLPQDGCTVLAYIVRVNGVAGNYFDYKLRTEANADFTTYDQTARLRVVNPMSSGVGF